MSEKHTPGPWRAVRNGFSEVGVMDSSGNWLTYEAGDIRRMGKGEVEANARLIAAAPDLLAELQRIADANPKEWDEETRDQFQLWAQNRARHAIAKATGA